GVEVMGMGRIGDLGRFAPGAVVAPEIVIVDGIEALIDRNDAGACRVERDGLDRAPLDTRRFKGATRSQRQRVHMVGVALGGVIGIVLLAKERVVCRAAAEAALFTIEDGDSNAQGSEVYACYGAHKLLRKTPAGRPALRY